MTLCALWWDTEDQTLRMASDSRLSLSDGESAGSFDVVVKIVCAPLKIRFPKDRESKPLYRMYGVCATGDARVSRVAKDSLIALTSCLAAMNGAQALSMNALAQAAAHVLERAVWETVDMRAALSGNPPLKLPTATLILVGHCQAEEMSRAFRIAMDNNHIQVKEITPEAGIPQFFGSGAEKAYVLSNNLENPLDPPHIVLQLSRDSECTDVGGPVQCGRMQGEDFVLDVVRVHELGGPYNYFVGGLDIGGGVNVNQATRSNDLRSAEPLRERPEPPDGFHWVPQAQTNLDVTLVSR